MWLLDQMLAKSLSANTAGYWYGTIPVGSRSFEPRKCSKSTPCNLPPLSRPSNMLPSQRIESVQHIGRGPESSFVQNGAQSSTETPERTSNRESQLTTIYRPRILLCHLDSCVFSEAICSSLLANSFCLIPQGIPV
jgi:hypothetical protein